MLQNYKCHPEVLNTLKKKIIRLNKNSQKDKIYPADNVQLLFAQVEEFFLRKQTIIFANASRVRKRICEITTRLIRKKEELSSNFDILLQFLTTLLHGYMASQECFLNESLIVTEGTYRFNYLFHICYSDFLTLETDCSQVNPFLFYQRRYVEREILFLMS